MWKRFVEDVRCPLCKSKFELVVFNEIVVSIGEEFQVLAQEKGLLGKELNVDVEKGLLICKNCKVYFPILNSVPILLPYLTPYGKKFCEEFHQDIARINSELQIPSGKPPEGEEFVMKSFSQEWRDYQYDGVLWEMNYRDHEKMVAQEIGTHLQLKGKEKFLEVGCGLGMTSFFAQKNYKCDVVGIDLSLAVFKAKKQFLNNPFLHFVQASVFALPFEKNSFDLIYSRGVLHHTFSTRDAFRNVVPLCRQMGCAYIWVYGSDSIRSNLFRRMAYALEVIFRPILSRYPSSVGANMVLGILALGYMTFNRVRRFSNTQAQKLSFSRAVHAARDRFTPRFAHRHDPEEVVKWFKDEGFEDVCIVDWHLMPSADQKDYRRNVGVRGKMKNS